MGRKADRKRLKSAEKDARRAKKDARKWERRAARLEARRTFVSRNAPPPIVPKDPFPPPAAPPPIPAPEPPRKRLSWSDEFGDAIRMLKTTHTRLDQPYLGRIATGLAKWLAPFVRDGIEPADEEILNEIDRLYPVARKYYDDEDE